MSSRHSARMSASAVSVAAATMPCPPHDAPLVSLDDFTSLLGEREARALLDLLRLAVAGRVEAPNATNVLTNVLQGNNRIYPDCSLISSALSHSLLVSNVCRFAAMSAGSEVVQDTVREACIVELEQAGAAPPAPPPVTQDSPHPYPDDCCLSGELLTKCIADKIETFDFRENE